MTASGRRNIFYLLALVCLSGPALAEYAPRQSALENTRQAQGINVPMNSMHVYGESGLAFDGQGDIFAPNTFSNEIEAVIAASDDYNPRSIAEDREYMGAILVSNGRYSYTVEGGEVGQDQITVRIRVPAGSSIADFWHTHGAAANDRSYFSEVDTALATEWNKPFYLADYTGVLKVYKPGDKLISQTKAKRLGLPQRNGFSKGSRVQDLRGRTIQIATVKSTPVMLCESQSDLQMIRNNFQSVYM